MNTLRFDVREHRDADDEAYIAVHIMIDGVDLEDRIRAIEAEYYKNEDYDGHPFTGLWPEQLHRNLTQAAVIRGKQTFLLICMHCLCMGCMDFNTTVKEQDDKVVWTNFCAVWGHAECDYSSLNGMEFDKLEYRREVERLKDYFGQDSRGSCTE